MRFGRKIGKFNRHGQWFWQFFSAFGRINPDYLGLTLVKASREDISSGSRQHGTTLRVPFFTIHPG
jgi:hypothetical protein